MNDIKESQNDRVNTSTRPESSVLRKEKRPSSPPSYSTTCPLTHTHDPMVTYTQKVIVEITIIKTVKG